MQRLSFSIDRWVRLFDVAYRVVGFVGRTEVVLQAVSGMVRNLTIEALAEFYRGGNLRGPKDGDEASKPIVARTYLATDSLTAKAREKGATWHALFRKAHGHPEAIMEMAKRRPGEFHELCKAVGFKKTPSFSAIRRKLFRWYKAREEAVALAPDYHLRGGKGKSRLDPEVEEMIDWHIDNEFLAQKLTLITVYQILVGKIHERNQHRPQLAQLDIPSLETFRRRVHAKGAYVIYAAKYGKAAAERRYRSTGRAYEFGGEFEDEAQIDHTPLDLFVVDEKTGLALGRPRLTILLHTLTRAILGMDIGFDGNSTSAVLDCVKHAIVPKEPIAVRDIRVEWKCFGMFQVVKCDNGPEFHSEDFKRCIQELGLGIHYCPARRPWFKGQVERFLGTINRDFSASLPGASESHFYKRQNQTDPANDAVISIGELKLLLNHWAVNIYMQSPHKALKQQTPQQAWDAISGIQTLELPAVPENVDLVCSLQCRRRLQHYGIEIFGLTSFNNDAIQQFRRKYQFQRTIHVNVRYSPHRLDRIWMKEPDTGYWIEVINSDFETRELSENQIRALNRIRRERRLQNGTKTSLLEAKKILRDEINELMWSKSQRHRRRAALLLGALLQEDREPRPRHKPKAQKETPPKSKPPQHRWVPPTADDEPLPVYISEKINSPRTVAL